MVKITVNVEQPVATLLTAADAAGGSRLDGPWFDTMRKQWLSRYGTYVRRRFISNSLGEGGDWAPLALATILARRSGGSFAGVRRARKAGTAKGRDTRGGGGLVDSGRAVSTLRDTGTLYRALAFKGRGNVSEDTPLGVEFGFAAIPHAARKGGANKSIAQIARYHDAGGGNLPQRRILWQPDAALLSSLARDAARAVKTCIEGGKAAAAGAGGTGTAGGGA
jgi:hypothetical protein